MKKYKWQKYKVQGPKQFQQNPGNAHGDNGHKGFCNPAWLEENSKNNIYTGTKGFRRLWILLNKLPV